MKPIETETLKLFLEELYSKQKPFRKPYNPDDSSSGIIYGAFNEAIAYIEKELVASGDLIVGLHHCPCCEQMVEFTTNALPYCDWCCTTIRKLVIEKKRKLLDPDWTPSAITIRDPIKAS